MSLLQWTFLFGAVAVVGPIVAHLLSKPRFRRVPFTMLRFLRRGQSQSHARRRLRDLLILLLRCTIIVLIAVLFARPVLRVESEPPKQRVVYHVALDDSMSMAYRDGDQTLFERTTEQALDLIKQAPQDSTFCIYGLASGRSSQGLAGNEAVAAIEQLKVVPACVRLDDFLSALKQAREVASPADTLWTVVMSDFTPRTLREFEQIRQPVVVDEIHHKAIAADEPVQNVAICSARIARVVGNILNLDATVCSYGPAEQQCRLTARVADSGPICEEELSLVAGRPEVVPLRIDLGPHLRRADQPCLPIELNLSCEDGLIEDNTYRIAAYVPARTQTNVVLVHGADEGFLFEAALQVLSDQEAADRTTGPDSPGGLKLTSVAEGRLTSFDLAGADVVVFARIGPDASGRMGDLRAVAQKGGRLVFFVGEVQDSDAAGQLWRAGLLPAHPQRGVQGIAYPQAQPCTGASLGLDERAARSLCNYRLDHIALKGYWSCQPAEQAECLWRLNSGEGFVHAMPCGHGLSILVNTSIDDSLGLLAKSAAWVAFCDYLIGKEDSVQQFCFSAGERPVLRMTDGAARDRRTPIPVENCDRTKGLAVLQGNMMVLPTPVGIGWMKTTLRSPSAATRDGCALYVGINLPAGETDLSRPTQDVIAGAMQRAFITDADQADRARPASFTPVAREFRDKPIWPVLAWAAILLLLLESTVANRLKR